MSRARPPYLIRRGDTFYVRVRVPLDLADRVGVLEVKRSLGTGRLSEARFLGSLAAAHLKEAFNMIRADQPDRARCTTIINGCFRDLLAGADTMYVPRSDEPRRELHEQQALSDERLRDLERQIAARRPDEATKRWALRFLSERGVAVAHDSADADLLVHGILRGLAEQQRLFQFRLTESALPYSPTDPLAARSISAESGQPDPGRPATVIGPSLADAVDKYLYAKRSSWTAKTYKTNKQKLSFFVEHIGGSRPLAAVAAEDARAYRDALLRLRSKHHVGAGNSFAERQTESLEHRISPKTAGLIFESCKSFLRWARSEGYLAANPAEGILLSLPKATKGKKPRRPFTAEELAILFRTPSFTGFKSAARRFETGPLAVRDAYWWIPILGFYTGARLGELVQLHQSDIHVDGPIPYVSVNEENGGERGSGTEKHVKSAAGVRNVPLHPDIMALGFKEFVTARRKHHKAKTRIFWEIGYGSDGQASSLFSKWFARLLDKAGLTDRALVFHSFRHGMEDAFRNRLTPQYVIDRIIGHSDGQVSGQYGQGTSLDVAYAAVQDLKLPVSVPALLGSEPHN